MHSLRNITANRGDAVFNLFSFVFSGGLSLFSTLWVSDTYKELMVGHPAKFLGGLVLGVLAWLWFISAIRAATWMARRFGQDEAAISISTVVPGNEFKFVYSQPIKLTTRIKSVKIYLVYNEHVHTPGPDRGNDYDFGRLFHEEVIQGRTYKSAEMIEARCSLRLPSGDIGVRNPFMDRDGARLFACRWKIMVAVHPVGAWPFWREYELQPMNAVQGGSAADDLAGLFDVFLVDTNGGRILALINALNKAVPYMSNPGQLSGALPCLIQERLSREAAEKLKGALEEAGGVVEIRPAELGLALA